MIQIRNLKDKNIINIIFKCKLAETDRQRDFVLNRCSNEAILATFKKLYTNYMKQLDIFNKTLKNNA